MDLILHQDYRKITAGMLSASVSVSVSTFCVSILRDVVILCSFHNSASFVVFRYQVLQIHTEDPDQVTDLQEYLTDNGMEVVDLINK